jgi:hypothetical protein
VLLLGVDPERRVHEEDIVQEQRSEPSKPQAVSEDDENCRNPASHWQAWLPTSFLTLPAPQATQLELPGEAGSKLASHWQFKAVGSALADTFTALATQEQRLEPAAVALLSGQGRQEPTLLTLGLYVFDGQGVHTARAPITRPASHSHT